MNKYEWSDVISAIREKLDITSGELARRLGVKPQRLNDIEKGRSKDPSSDFLLRLIDRIGFNPNYMKGQGPLLTGEKDDPGYQEKDDSFSYKIPGEEGRLIVPEQIPMSVIQSPSFTLFRFNNGKAEPYATNELDANAITLLPLFGQPAAAGPGQEPNQLSNIEAYIPVVFEMLGGAVPRNCGIVRVVGDSMTDMGLFNGDLVIFDRTQFEGDGVYVISIAEDVRVKRIEYRPFERKIIISSENIKRYPNPEVISYEQAENMLRIHGKVICWMHRHPY